MNRLFSGAFLKIMLVLFFLIVYFQVSAFKVGANNVGTTIVIFEVLTLVYIIFKSRKLKISSPSIILPVVLLLLIQEFQIFLLLKTSNIFEIIGAMANPIFWAFPFLFGFFYFNQHNKPVNKNILKVFSTIIVLVVVYYFYQQRDYIFNIYNRTSGIIDIYFAVAMLPFIFLIKNRIVKVGIVALTGIAVAASFKLTGIIAYFCAVLTYIYLAFNIQNKLMVTKVFYFALSIFIVFLVAGIIYSVADETIDNKIKLSSETSGSGRKDIWTKTLSLQFDSDFSEWIFGHIDDPRKRLNIDTLAHNEFIEILFKYGIFALILFLAIFKGLIRENIKLYKESSVYSYSFTAAIIIAFVISMFSHTITLYGGSVICLSLFFGFVLGKCR